MNFTRLPLKKLIFGLTHNYSAYAMIRHASKLVRENELGDIRIVQAEHATGWAAKPTASKQALWRFDPAQSGIASVLFDVGTHVHHLLRYITGLEVSELSAEMHTCVPDRKIYDDVHVNLRLSNGARGSLWASVAATGQEHGLCIRVFGSKASLEWRHEYPHYLTIRYLDGPIHQLAQGHSVLVRGIPQTLAIEIRASRRLLGIFCQCVYRSRKCNRRTYKNRTFLPARTFIPYRQRWCAGSTVCKRGSEIV